MPTSGPGATGARARNSCRLAGGACAFFGAMIAPALADGPDAADLALYATCTSAAEAQPLGARGAALCAKVYTRIKLSFLPDMSPEALAALTPSERAEVNRAGYAAYTHWKRGSFDFAENLRD